MYNPTKRNRREDEMKRVQSSDHCSDIEDALECSAGVAGERALGAKSSLKASLGFLFALARMV